MRQPGFEMRARGIASDPLGYAGCKIPQLDQAETIKHEACHKEQSCDDVHLAGCHVEWLSAGGCELRGPMVRPATNAMTSQTAARSVIANTVRIS